MACARKGAGSTRVHRPNGSGRAVEAQVREFDTLLEAAHDGGTITDANAAFDLARLRGDAGPSTG